MLSSDSSDDDDRAPRQQTSSTMKSIFATDQRASAADSAQPFKYVPKKKDPLAAVAAIAPPVERGSAPAPGQSASTTAAYAVVQCYRGDSYVGPAMLFVAVSERFANIRIIDREKRTQLDVRIDDSLQLLPSVADHQYATLYDPITQLHWSLMFAKSEECHKFIASALAVQHYFLIQDGPRSAVVDLAESHEGIAARQGDTVIVSYAIYQLQRIMKTYTCGKLIEEVVVDAPKRALLGSLDVMLGIEEVLQGSRAGTWKLAFIGPRKTKTSGLGNPEIGPKDTVVAFVRLHAVESTVPAQAAEGIMSIEDRRPPPSVVAKNEAAAAAAAVAAAPAPVPNPNDDIIKVLLLQTMQMQQVMVQQAQHPPPAPPPPPPPPAPSSTEAPIPAHVERSLDRINQQLSALYEKIDRMDFEKKLETNNEKLERMVKKAVGKMPTNDVDIEDMAKDRDQLLAKIEALKARVDEMTDNYHEALQQLGKSKEILAAAKNDLAIEKSTGEQALKDLKDRHRLTLVEAELTLRRSVEKAREDGLKDGHEAGYQQGYQAGKIDAMTGEGASESVQKLRDLIHAKEQEIIALQTRNGELEHRMYEDRRLATEEKTALRGLIDRLEAKERQRQNVIYDHATAVAKTIRRVMNATYANFESQVYAMEKPSIEIADILDMAMVAVRTEARQATEELKAEAMARASEPAHMAAAAAAAEQAEAEAEADAAYNEENQAGGEGEGVEADTATNGVSNTFAVLTRSHIAAAGLSSVDGTTEEVLREMARERPLGEYAGVSALADAYAAPTHGSTELADEDEILAYLNARKESADEG